MADTPNAVLRGGPLDGTLITGDLRLYYVEGPDGTMLVYVPTSELDDEHSTLLIYVFDRAEPVVS